ncbi:hypothetical protein BaRGS_00040347, partial [Batillaria attramentaria]
MGNTGSDPTRPQTTDAGTEDVGTGDKQLASSTSRTTTSSDVNVGIEEISPSSAEDQATTTVGGDTENRTDKTKTPWNLAERVWRQVNDTHHGRFTRLDFVLGIVGIILYIVDIATDLQLAISYFLDGHVIYGGLTTAFIGLAYIVVSVFGLGLFFNMNVPTVWWVCRIVFLILGLSPVIVMVETMYYGMKSRARHREGERAEEERYTDHAEWTVVVRLIEGFLEAAPQLCFQLYITFKEKPDDDVGAEQQAASNNNVGNTVHDNGQEPACDTPRKARNNRCQHVQHGLSNDNCVPDGYMDNLSTESNDETEQINQLAEEADYEPGQIRNMDEQGGHVLSSGNFARNLLNIAVNMPVEGLPPTVEAMLNALLTKNSLSPYKIEGRGDSAVVILRLTGGQPPNMARTYRKKPPSQVRRDKKRAEEKRAADTNQAGVSPSSPSPLLMSAPPTASLEQ